MPSFNFGKFLSENSSTEMAIRVVKSLGLKVPLESVLDWCNRRRNYHNGQFNSITMDTTNYLSDLCRLGAEFNTDKSQLSPDVHYRHSYTAVYNLLFHDLRHKPINFAEIGILNNASIRMWRSYFSAARIDGFEYSEKRLAHAREFDLPDTEYHFVDVNDREIIRTAFEKTGRRYDIIIDDSTHFFDHQINVANIAKDFLTTSGTLVIEDIYTKKKMYREESYYAQLKHLADEFSDIFFVHCQHKNNYAGLWNNHKLLVLKK